MLSVIIPVAAIACKTAAVVVPPAVGLVKTKIITGAVVSTVKFVAGATVVNTALEVANNVLMK